MGAHLAVHINISHHLLLRRTFFSYTCILPPVPSPRLSDNILLFICIDRNRVLKSGQRHISITLHPTIRYDNDLASIYTFFFWMARILSVLFHSFNIYLVVPSYPFSPSFPSETLLGDWVFGHWAVSSWGVNSIECSRQPTAMTSNLNATVVCVAPSEVLLRIEKRPYACPTHRTTRSIFKRVDLSSVVQTATKTSHWHDASLDG